MHRETGAADGGHTDAEFLRIGERALAFAREHDVIAAVVLGRAYTITNQVLDSNVPNLLREQGAIAIPVDCYPIAPGVRMRPSSSASRATATSTRWPARRCLPAAATRRARSMLLLNSLRVLAPFARRGVAADDPRMPVAK